MKRGRSIPYRHMSFYTENQLMNYKNSDIDLEEIIKE